jgi:hypothetical protein
MLVILYTLITVAGLWLSMINGFQDGILFELMLIFVFSIMFVVGLIIISRQLNNVIGWLLIVAGFSSAIFTISSEFAQFVLFSQDQYMIFGLLSAWVSQWIWIGYAASLLLGLPLLFPNGKFLSPRWRVFGWLTVFYLLLLWTSVAMRPGTLTDFATHNNPFGIKAFEIFPPVFGQILTLLSLPLVFGAVFSLYQRFRGSRGDQRAQIKWFFFAACLLLVAIIAGFAQTLGIIPSGNNQLSALIFGLQATLFTISIGIAIQKYHLYEIDLVIRRTLVYGVLTVLLIIFYYVSVVLLQQAFRALTGQDSPVAIVISTLVIAALFNPLRGQIQEFIDRRFYRRKYDAQQALAEFAATARDEVELDQLTGQLLSVVQESLQPEQTELWLVSMKTEESR